ncbi:CBS domain-containing protein [Streptomyces carpaticus]|uniref:CBS domain-containing protein n=1 Tax=Streptomyces carpaticus TaxID=285558 RepID=A0ABV4ZT75_9ACTN
MTTARDIMTPDPVCADSDDSVLITAATMREQGVGALPVFRDNQLRGMITDRDIVIGVIGQGDDPSTVTAGDLAQGEAVTIQADDDVDEALTTMTEHGVRRLPVMDDGRLVGVLAQADVARALPDPKVGKLVAALSSTP